jgi:hypothetical protein
MAAEPVFAVTPRIGAVSIATADSSYTAPTNVGTLLTGVTAGTRVNEIVIKCAATSAAAVVRIFLYDGTTYWLFDEVLVAAATGSSTVVQFRTRVTYDNLVLPSSSWSVRVTTSVSQATHVTAFGADL